MHPSTRDLPLLWNRSDLWYTWQTRPTGTVHTVARYRGPNAAAGDGTSVGGTDHPISWCRDYRGGRSFYTGMGRVEAAYAEDDFRSTCSARSSGPPASCAATARRRSTPTTAARS